MLDSGVVTTARSEVDAIVTEYGVARLRGVPLSRRAAALEAIALDPRHAAEALRLGAKALAGGWRSDPAVKARLCQRGRVFSKRPIPCILDGEMRYVAPFVTIGFRARAFLALAPEPLCVTSLDGAAAPSNRRS